MSQPCLAVIIVNWNTRDLLADCLQSVSEAIRSLRLSDSAVVVVDNASTDGSPHMVREGFPWVRLIENRQNAGFARANNQAVASSDSRYVLLLNSDTRVQSDSLERLVAFMEEHPHAGASGPRLLNSDGTVQPSCYPMLTPWREFWHLVLLEGLVHKATYSSAFWNRAEPQSVEVIKGACLLLRRAALDEVGLLDESYFMYTEEVDLCYRLAQADWQLWWVPAAKVIHYGEASSRQTAQSMYVQLYRSKIQFYRKFGGERQAALFKSLLRLAYWPRFGIAAAGASFGRGATQVGTYRRLLAELSRM